MSKVECAKLSPEEKAERRRALRKAWLSVPENRERDRASKQAWRKANYEKERARRAVLRHDAYWADPEKHREKIRMAGRSAYARNPHSFLLRGQQRRARKRLARVERITSKQWAQVIEQFGNSCAYCLRADLKLEIDHINPLILGGAHSLDNMVPCCRGCNASKCDSTLLQWLMRNVRLSPVVRP